MTGMMMDGLVVEDKRELSVSDRCDRCGAQAYVRVGLMAGELLLCGHHFNANKEALVSQAVSIRDETEKLLVKG